jgi:hypothetical protein
MQPGVIGLMSLKDEVEEIISRSLRGSPSMLRYQTEGGEPPLSAEEQLEMLQSVVLGIRQTLMLLAVCIESLDGDTSGT